MALSSENSDNFVIHSGRNLKILYFNAQSLVNKVNELNCTVVDLDPDLICVCESWTRNDISNAHLNVLNFDLVSRIDRKDTNRGIGGGLLIYAKNGLNVSVLKEEYLDEFNQCSAINVKNGKNSFYLCLVYRPHNLYDDNSVRENNQKLCNVLKMLPKP